MLTGAEVRFKGRGPEPRAIQIGMTGDNLSNKGYIDIEQFEQLDEMATARAVSEPTIEQTIAALTARVEAGEKTAATLIAAAAKAGISLTDEAEVEPPEPESLEPEVSELDIPNETPELPDEPDELPEPPEQEESHD